MLSRKKGFTLIELIIVIVIIGILAAITIIGYQSQAAAARRNSVYSAVSESVKALTACVANGDTITAVATGTVSPRTGLNLGGQNICTNASGTPAAAGTWPDLIAIGGNGWQYTSGTVAANGLTAAITITGPAFGTPATTPTISCPTTGTSCTKNW